MIGPGFIVPDLDFRGADAIFHRSLLRAQAGLVWAGASGIAAEDLPHIFERFYRGQCVTKNDVPGIGLGLAIVKECDERLEAEEPPIRN